MNDTDRMPNSASAVVVSSWGASLTEELTRFEYEARQHQRTKLTIEITVHPTNGNGSVLGTPFTAVSTDISAGGIGFLHTSGVPDKFLAITLSTNDRRADVLVEVVRCRSVGSLYEIGARFIRLLDPIES